VVIQAPAVQAPRAQSAVAELRHDALATGLMKSPIRTTVNPTGTVETIDVPLVGDGQSSAAVHALHVLRSQVVPATVGRVAGVQAAVTGETAGDVDFAAAARSHMPIVFAFVLGFAFILLLLTFRSIVIPLKAIVLNLLSVGAAYGVLVLIFQQGRLESLLGFTSIGGVTDWLPLFLFVILFGLSMDYHVLILSRVKEDHDGGMRTEDAVGHGISATASVVTSAAAVMVAVFAIFATLAMIDFKMMGVGLAVAVLLDATIVRAILLPSAMKLLGDWNWYLPRWLEWLPEFRIEAPAARPEPHPRASAGRVRRPRSHRIHVHR
jgi:RND superfamily putative drug exporter